MAADGQEEKQQQFTVVPDQQQQQKMQEHLRAAQRQLHEVGQTWLTTQQQQQEIQQQLEAAKQEVLQITAQQQWDEEVSAGANLREAKRYKWRMEWERLQHQTVLRKQQERLLKARDLCLQWLTSHQPQKETPPEAETVPSLSARERAVACSPPEDVMPLIPAAEDLTRGTPGSAGSQDAAAGLSSLSASSMLSKLLLPLLQEAIDICSYGDSSSSARGGGRDLVSVCSAAAVPASQRTDAAAEAKRTSPAQQHITPRERRHRYNCGSSVATRLAAASAIPAAIGEKTRSRNPRRMLQQLDNRSAIAVHSPLVSPVHLMVTEVEGRGQQQGGVEWRDQVKQEVEELHLDESEKARQQRSDEAECNWSRRIGGSETSSRERISSNSTPHSYTSNSSYVESRIQSAREARQATEEDQTRQGGQARMLRSGNDTSRTQDSCSSPSQDTASPSPRPPARVSAWRGRPAFVPRLNLTGEESDDDEEEPAAAAPLLPLPQQQQQQPQYPDLGQATPQHLQQAACSQRQLLQAHEYEQQMQQQQQHQREQHTQQVRCQHRVEQQLQGSQQLQGQQQQEVEQSQAVHQSEHDKIEETLQIQRREVILREDEQYSVRAERQELVAQQRQQGKTAAVQKPRDKGSQCQLSHFNLEAERKHISDPWRSETVCDRHQQQINAPEREQQQQLLLKQSNELGSQVQEVQQEELKDSKETFHLDDKEATPRQEAAAHLHIGKREKETAQESPTFRKNEIEAAKGGARRLLCERSAGDKQERQPAQREQREVIQHESAVPEEAPAGREVWGGCTSESSSIAPLNSLPPCSNKNRRSHEVRRQQQRAYQTRDNTLEEQGAAPAAKSRQREGINDRASQLGEQQATAQSTAPCFAEVASLNRRKVEATWRLQQQLQQQQQEHQQHQQVHHHQRPRPQVQQGQDPRSEEYGKSARREAEEAGALRRLSSVCLGTSNEAVDAAACARALPGCGSAGLAYAPAPAEVEERGVSDVERRATADANDAVAFCKRREWQRISKVCDVPRKESDSGNCCRGMCDGSSNNNCSNCGEYAFCDHSSSSGDGSMCSWSSSSSSRASSNGYSRKECSRCFHHQQSHVSNKCNSIMFLGNGKPTKNKCNCIHSEEEFWVGCCSDSEAWLDHNKCVRRQLRNTSSRGSSREFLHQTSCMWNGFLAKIHIDAAANNRREETEQPGDRSPRDTDKADDPVRRGVSEADCRRRPTEEKPPTARLCRVLPLPSLCPLLASSSDTEIVSPAHRETLIYFDSSATAAHYGSPSLPSSRNIQIAGRCDQGKVHTTNGTWHISGSSAAVESHSQPREEDEEQEQQQQPQTQREEVRPALTEKGVQPSTVREPDPDADEDRIQQQQQQQDMLRQCRGCEERVRQQSDKPSQQGGVHCEKQEQKKTPQNSSRKQQKNQEQQSRAKEHHWQEVVEEEAFRNVPAATSGVSSEVSGVRDTRERIRETSQQSAPIPLATAALETHRSTSLAFIAMTGRGQLGVGGENQQAVQQLLKKSGFNPALILENRNGCNSRPNCRSNCGESSSNLAAALYSFDTSRYSLAANLAVRRRPQYAALTCSRERCCSSSGLTSSKSSNNSSERLIPSTSKMRAPVLSSTFAKAPDDEAAAAEHGNTPISRLPTTASTDEAFFAASRPQELSEPRETSVVLQQPCEDQISQLRQQHQHYGEDEHQLDHQQHQPKQQHHLKPQQLNHQQQQKQEQHQQQEQQPSTEQEQQHQQQKHQQQKHQQQKHHQLLLNTQTATLQRKDSGALAVASCVQEEQSSPEGAEKQVCFANSRGNIDTEKRRGDHDNGSCFLFAAQGVHGSIDATDESAARARANAETMATVIAGVAAATEGGRVGPAEGKPPGTPVAAEHIKFPNESAVAALTSGEDKICREVAPGNAIRVFGRTAALSGDERMSEMPRQTADRQDNCTSKSSTPAATPLLSEDEADPEIYSKNKWLCCGPSFSSINGIPPRAGVLSAVHRWRSKRHDIIRLPSKASFSNEPTSVAGIGCSLLPVRNTIRRRRASCDLGRPQIEECMSGKGQAPCRNRTTEKMYYPCFHQEMVEQATGESYMQDRGTLGRPITGEEKVKQLPSFDCKEQRRETPEYLSSLLQEKQEQSLVGYSENGVHTYGPDETKQTLTSIVADTLSQVKSGGEKKEEPFFLAGQTLITSSGFSPAAAPRTAAGQQRLLGSDAEGSVAQQAFTQCEIERVYQGTVNQLTQPSSYRPSRHHLPEMPQQPPFMHDVRATVRRCPQHAARLGCKCERMDDAQRKNLEDSSLGEFLLGGETTTLEISSLHYETGRYLPLRTSRSLSPCMRRLVRSPRPFHAKTLDAFSTSLSQTVPTRIAGRRLDITQASPNTSESKSGGLYGTHTSHIDNCLGNRTRFSVADDWGLSGASEAGMETPERCSSCSRSRGSYLQLSAVVGSERPSAEEHEHSLAQRRGCERMTRMHQCCSCCCSVKSLHFRSGVTTTRARKSVSSDSASLSQHVGGLGKNHRAFSRSSTGAGESATGNFGNFFRRDFTCDPH